MSRVTKFAACLASMSLSFILLAATSGGAEMPRTITVTATGSAESLPDTVEIVATVVGNAELAGDAVEKYRGSKRLAQEAFKQLGIDGLVVQGGGLALNSGSAPNMMAAIQGQGDQPKAGDKVAVQERLKITLGAVDKREPEKLLEELTRVVDAAKDAGVTIGSGPQGMMAIQLSGGKPAPLATFKLSNTDALREKAYQAAIDDARARAGRLAEMAGGRLGEVISIQEAVTPASSSGGEMNAYLALLGQAAGQSKDTSPELTPIPVSVTLTVQFALTK